MKPFEIFSLIGIILTVFLGIYNLLINIKSQRKVHRELIFNKQFDFFIQFQSLAAQFENKIFDINEAYSENEAIIKELYELAEEIDLLISKNELIIPDELYFDISKFSEECYILNQNANDNPISITKPIKTKFSNKNVNLVYNIRDYIGIEQLSKENKELVKNR